ncbi:uncharacterized protein LOC134476886 isoform X2 [Cavia porcellus]|uniref:uncharacterized protein LOC134476886 isoform X2 n=1 Tax=Cavia porcellus TaxID=10141 RepID=UPI002FE08D57
MKIHKHTTLTHADASRMSISEHTHHTDNTGVHMRGRPKTTHNNRLRHMHCKCTIHTSHKVTKATETPSWPVTHHTRTHTGTQDMPRTHRQTGSTSPRKLTDHDTCLVTKDTRSSFILFIYSPECLPCARRGSQRFTLLPFNPPHSPRRRGLLSRAYCTARAQPEGSPAPWRTARKNRAGTGTRAGTATHQTLPHTRARVPGCSSGAPLTPNPELHTHPEARAPALARTSPSSDGTSTRPFGDTDPALRAPPNQGLHPARNCGAQGPCRTGCLAGTLVREIEEEPPVAALSLGVEAKCLPGP